MHVPACGEEEACLFGRCLPLEPCDAVADCQNDDPCTRGECLLGNCVHEPACDDGDPCTADQCAPIGGKPVCLNTPTDGLPCDDYNPCTVGDTCSEGECRHGEDKDCDDGNPCTEAYCSSDGGCVQGGVGCDDQDECTDDYCDAEAGGCVNEPKVCGSGKRCAQPLGWCVRDRVCESDADCPDEDACWVGACAPVEDGQKKCTVVPLCSDDGNPCTDVHCKGGGEGEPTCLTENKSSDHGCEDGDPCTEGEHCVEGTCSGGSPKHCDDGDPCTEDSCDPESGECAFGPGSCPEDEVCIREHGGCVPAEPCNPDTPEMCEDGDACTHDSCEHDNCFHYPACDDGDMCTVDACSAGVHGGAECTYAPAEPGAPCEDGDLCTEGDTCEGLGCVPGEPRDCDDGDACTKDLCHPDEGCRHDWLKCEDFNPCTDDSCDPGSGCVFDRDEERDGCGGGGYCDNPHDRTALDDLDRGLRETGLKIEAGRLCVLRCSEDLERHGADCMAECVREIAFTHAADSSAKPGEPCESCLIGYGRCIYDTCHVACRLFPDSGHGLCGDCLDRADCDGALDECAGFPVGVGGDCETLADCLGEEDVCVDTVCEHGYCRARPKDCDDRNPCTNDRCEASGDCVNEASPMCAFEAECLDNVDDDGDELVDCEDPDCAGGLDCAAPCAEDSECDDGDACTTGLCVLGRCVFDYLGTEGLRCGGDQCRGPGYCNRGQCVNPGSPTHCDDGNPCTADRCDPALGCVAEPDDSGGCDDGDACTADDRCFGGRCTPGRPEICEDDNACTTDRCEGDKGCVFEDACDDAQVCVEGGCHDLRSCSSVTDCEDGDPCTHDECAASGNCVRRPFCEDGDPCTSDRCTVSDSQPSCTFDPNEADDAPCDDGNPCTGDDRCSSGACAPGEPVPCDDDNPCSEDTCVDFEGCSRASLDCDDHKACTIDLCVAEDGGCQHQPVVCPEGLECSEPDGACVDTGGP